MPGVPIEGWRPTSKRSVLKRPAWLKLFRSFESSKAMHLWSGGAGAAERIFTKKPPMAGNGSWVAAARQRSETLLPKACHSQLLRHSLGDERNDETLPLERRLRRLSRSGV